MKKLILIPLLALVMLLSACGSASTSETTTDTASSDTTTVQSGTLTSFTATDLEGNTQNQSIFKDYDLTMVNVWATFCSPCLSEMPDLGELSSEYKDKKFRMVGIVSDVYQSTDGSYDSDSLKTARELVSETGADYLHLLPGNDLNTYVLNSVSAVPTTFFVDSQGNRVGESYVGSKSKEEWSAIIDDLLSGVQS